ncbi:ABC transporter substrate-binding protein [Aliagarivorans marinus]|uniref:ABC transporter substrate-binding protein n=1 Tax=Aliagarivorans marinus TaxID=561965 RepID=UPI0003FACEB4|nr:extracellular solute-binding protein [Aliagarivorans marinus]
MNYKNVLTTAGLTMAVAFSASASAKESVTFMNNVPELVINKAWDDQIVRFEQANPDIEVRKLFVASEAFKQKVQTMLLSNDIPEIITSWGGQDYRDRAQKGLLTDLEEYLPTLTSEMPEAALNAYRVDGRLYGIPAYSKPTMLYYNKQLLEQAGVDPKQLETWDGFLAAIDQLHEAGITPMALAGVEGWPAHFYFSYLAMRIGGPDVFKNALDEGFDDPAFLEAANQLLALAEKKPWQRGYMSSNIDQAYALFGNGEAAMQLQGEWQYKLQQDSSRDGKGIGVENVGLARFPAVEGGSGQLTDIISGIDGYAFTRSATPTTAKFVDFWLNEENLTQMAEQAMMLPVTPGAVSGIQEPVMRQMAQMVSESSYVHGFVDQVTGAHLGGAINDVSSELVAGSISAEQAVAALQEAWEFR